MRLEVEKVGGGGGNLRIWVVLSVLLLCKRQTHERKEMKLQSQGLSFTSSG